MNNILMNEEMTKAILDGSKVQTRRVIKSVKDCGVEFKKFKIKENTFNAFWEDKNKAKMFSQPIEDFILQEAKYQIGETIWVREPAKVISAIFDGTVQAEYLSDGERTYFKVDRFYKNGELPKWIDEIQGIPNGCIKEMARIFLKITDVRVERLQDISDEDCLKEGIYETDDNDCTGNYKVYTTVKPNIKNGIILNDTYCSAYEAFEQLWNSTSPKGYKWEDNPYVFVYTFERIENAS